MLSGLRKQPEARLFVSGRKVVSYQFKQVDPYENNKVNRARGSFHSDDHLV